MVTLPMATVRPENQKQKVIKTIPFTKFAQHTFITQRETSQIRVLGVGLDANVFGHLDSHNRRVALLQELRRKLGLFARLFVNSVQQLRNRDLFRCGAKVEHALVTGRHDRFELDNVDLRLESVRVVNRPGRVANDETRLDLL